MKIHRSLCTGVFYREVQFVVDVTVLVILSR